MATASVIIPTHNRPELLQRALASVYAQTYTDFEVIVVDDGDSPSAKESLMEYLTRPNFRYLETSKNTGGSATRNRGIHEAQGEYIAFLDDDDAWLPRKLEMQIPYFEKGEKLGFVFSAVNTMRGDHVYTSPIQETVRDYREISKIRFNGFLTSSLVVRKTVFDDVGLFDESLPSHQEADLILRIAQKYEGVGVKEPLTTMYTPISDDHIGGDVNRRIKGREMLLHKHAALFKNSPDLLARHYFWLALQYRMKGESETYGKLCLQAFRMDARFRFLVHAVYGYCMHFIRIAKKFLLHTLFKPAHFGLLLRLMYFRRYVPSFVMKTRGVRVLDAGCGRGRFTEVLAHANPEAKITSVDIQSQKEWETYPYPNATFKIQDLHTLSDENAYDLIMSVDVLEHILDNNQIIPRFYRALKKGGYLFLMVPCDAASIHIFPRKWFAKFYEWDAKEHIGVQYTKEGWGDILKKAGFEIEIARYTFTLWGVFAWECEYLLSEHPWGRKANLLLMPLYRFFGLLDIYFPIGKGNNLIVAHKR